VSRAERKVPTIVCLVTIRMLFAILIAAATLLPQLTLERGAR
jgi:hypothetical protein